VEWAKKFNFNRPSSINNFLEPAKSSANLVMQTILGPPFTWWWNNEEVTFTCTPTAQTFNTTGNVQIAAGVLTLTVTSTAALNSLWLLSGFTTVTQLNGQSIVILTNTGTVITARIGLPNTGPTADTGVLTAGTTQDYTLLLPEFSHIEHSSLLDIGANPSKWMELKTQNDLALESQKARPTFVGPHVEDAAGNVTFRVMPAPNLAYPVSLHVQKAAPLITSLNQTWGPLPDFMQYIYNWGFLSLMWSFADDPRAQWASQKFVTHLLGRADGLTEMERNIFLNNWSDLTMTEQQKRQQGIQARGNQ
ncbi:MAG: hypothetical protein ACREQ5_32075, partial [Candidatus Dormibacteria bacterium]